MNPEPITFATLSMAALTLLVKIAYDYIKKSSPPPAPTNGNGNGIKTLAEIIIEQKERLEALRDQVKILQDNKEELSAVKQALKDAIEQLVALQLIIIELSRLIKKTEGE